MQIVLQSNNDIISNIINACNNIKETNDIIEIIFDKDVITIQEILSELSMFINWEYDYLNDNADNIINIVPIFKNLNIDDKIEIIKLLINAENVINSTLLFNLFLFIKSNDGFETDSLFNDKQVLIDSIEEFLDIKIAIKEFLNPVLKNIAMWYLSIITSLHNNIEQVFGEEIKTVPIKYAQLITLLSFEELSKITSKFDDISMKDVQKVIDGKIIWDNLNAKIQPSNEIVQSLFDYIKETYDGCINRDIM